MKQETSQRKNTDRIKTGSPGYRAVKRALDVTFSVVLLIVLLPLFIVFSLIIFFTDFHNPIYVQKRSS